MSVPSAEGPAVGGPSVGGPSVGEPAPEIPYRFDRTHSTADVVEAWSSLAPGEESGVTVGVAGRVMLLRNQGKAAFGELRDASGALQLLRPRRGDGALRHVRAVESR